MDFALVYFAASFSVFVGVVLKSWFVYDDFFDLCMALASDRVLSIVSMNFLFATALCVSRLIIWLFSRGLPHSDLGHALDKLRSVGHGLWLYLFVMDHDIPMSLLSIIPFPLLFRYISFAFNHTISSFSVTTRPPDLPDHQRLLTGQIIMMTAALCCSLAFFRWHFSPDGHAFVLLIAVEFSHSFFDFGSGILNHIVFIGDRLNFGNSQAAFRTTLIGSLIFEMCHLILELWFLVSQISNRVFLLFVLRSIWRLLSGIFRKIRTIYRWHKLHRVLGQKLPTPTAEELAIAELCIYCRSPMDMEQAKKLPCGHLMHLDCLERWVGERLVCPLCERDLSSILKDDPLPPAPVPLPKPADREIGPSHHEVLLRLEAIRTELIEISDELKRRVQAQDPPQEPPGDT
jgi:E3 ubiquitin-protein ligase synoviolin